MSVHPRDLAMTIAADMARQRLTARGFTFKKSGVSPERPDPLAEQARAESAREAGVRAIQLAAAGGFAEYAQRNLRIRNTAGTIVPFHLNNAQVELHKVVVKQLADLGRVRIIVLKARQLGISTYITGRAYYNISRRTGQSGLIIAHEKKTAKQIHSFVRTFHDYMDSRFRPHAQRASDGELLFGALRSSLTIATAKNVESGRGFTQQFIHASEVAFYPNAAAIMKGANQGIHDVPNTEAWQESTAIGPSGYFYQACQMARKGELGDYRFVFLPWFLLPERVRTPPEGFEDSMSATDREYMELHQLSLAQMAWRHMKRQSDFMHGSSDIDAASIAFGVEYPAVPEDAFNAAELGSFISVSSVVKARRAWRDNLVPINLSAPRVLGVDPSWMGNDKFRIWGRQGRRAWRVGGWKHASITSSVGRLLSIIEAQKPDYICVDAVGVGAGVYDLLVEVLESKNIRGVVFCVMAGASAEDDTRHVLVRDECWSRMKDWFTNPPQVAIEDVDEIQADLTSVRNKGDSHRRVRLMSKDEMRKPPLSLPSPDDGDALSLTFFLSEIGTLGRAGVRSGGIPDVNRPFNYKIGASL